ncbi:MAG: Gfo/Idh/MocA family oxidoreductase [Clostridia bacterium]|nr:Gfo/Idh/MocA family oxidoreductase [Clostridia bacterium]
MKKIGFVDYYISEWHANNYPAWISEITGDYKVSYVWAEKDNSPVDGVTTAQWCEKFGAQQCETLEELCEKCDVIVILSPGFSEKHLPYAQVVLPYGKRTYIDKTFSPDLAEAKEIFALAEKYGTPFFSTSALRYADELDTVQNCRHMVTTGSGRSADEYIVHQAEMIVKKLGEGARAVRCEGDSSLYSFRIRYDDDRSGTMLFSAAYPFTVYMAGDTARYAEVKSSFFKKLIADMIRFFEEGTVSFDVSETLEVMKIREGAMKSIAAPGEWITL